MPIDVLESARAAYSSQPAWDALVREDIYLPAVRQQGRPASCETCYEGTCCHQSVIVSLYEALAIVHVVILSKRDSPSFRSLLRVRDELQRTETIWQHWERRLPCVFLGPRNLCSIYAARPEACRSAHTWRPSEECRELRDGHPVTLDGHNRCRMSLDYSSLRLQESWGLASDRVLMGTIPGSVLCVLESTDAAEDEQRRQVLQTGPWMSGEYIERLLSEEPLFNPSDLMSLFMGRPARSPEITS